MPSALILTAVSAVLKRTLENGLADPAVAESAGSDILVTAQAPDHIAVGGEERAQVNLFLYQLTPNTGLRNARGDGPRPLTVDLHYCVAAYGNGDLVVETLLGAVLRVFQETPALDRAAFAATLAAYTAADGGRIPPPAAAGLARSRVAEQVAGLRLEAQFLTLEDSSRLWSAAQARYRPSLYYKASVALLAP
jgi:hypothetical protein